MPSFRKVVLLLTGVALTTTACNNTLNTPKLESDIKADIERQGRRLALRQVTCPDDVARQLNASFRCVGELDPEGTFAINVVQTDSKGTVRWEIPNSRVMINLVKVESQIQEDLAKAVGKRAVIDCGSEAYRVNQAGDLFECQVVGGVVAGTDQINAVLIKVDSDGNLAWQEIRQPTQAVAIAPAQAATGTANPVSASVGAAASAQPTATAPGAAANQPSKRPAVFGDSE